MKLYRFTAPDAPSAITKIRDRFGNDAIIYSIRKLTHGVEAIASDELHDYQEQALEVDNTPRASATVADEQLNKYLQTMEENINKLSNHVNSLHHLMLENKPKKQHFDWKNTLRNLYLYVCHLLQAEVCFCIANKQKKPCSHFSAGTADER